MTRGAPVYVRLAQRFSVPPERVYDAWLNPELLGSWMFGSGVRDEEVVRIMVDARVGGTFSFVVRRQGALLDHTGTYLELDRPRRLVFTWGVGVAGAPPADGVSRVTLDIAPLAAGAELTLTHEMDPKWADVMERTAAGWTTILAAIAAALTTA
jgi:uncharacterized protein YndB with AHSA1/START domain